jgi:hypothetical protein
LWKSNQKDKHRARLAKKKQRAVTTVNSEASKESNTNGRFQLTLAEQRSAFDRGFSSGHQFVALSITNNG